MSGDTKTRTSAYVATILDDGFRVAINKGRNNGIEKGDQFLIVHQGPEILDPETHESLGQLELVRGRGKIIQVEEKFSVLESLETRPRRRDLSARWGVGSALEALALPGAVFETEKAPFEKVSVKDLVKPL